MGTTTDVRRTAIGFSIIAFAAVSANVGAYVVARSVERESIRVADAVTARSYAAERLAAAFGERVGATYAYVASHNPDRLEDVGRGRAIFRDELEHLRRHAVGKEEQ